MDEDATAAAIADHELNERQRRESEMTPINEIAAALAKAQCEMSNPNFDATNPHFRNRYASLAAVRNAVVPVLAKHGIACLQDLKTDAAGISCETLLTHTSGQQLRFGPLVLPVSKQDAQGFGSAATYARRYQLMAVAGVVGDADDDAEAAVGRTSQNVTTAQAKQLQTLAEEVGADVRKFCKYMGVTALTEIPAAKLKDALAALEAKRKPAQEAA